MAEKKAVKTMGRPPASEPYQKVTLCLYNRQILFLDKVSLILQAKTGRHIPRAELVRAIVERASKTMNTEKPGPAFFRSLYSLFPGVRGKV